MKFVLPHLKIGQILPAKVEECLPDREVLLNCQGDLIRVANDTNQTFNIGQTINVEVTSLEPLTFRLVVGKRKHRRLRSIDYTI